MNKKLTIVSVCRMGAGTFEAKFLPLSRLENIEKIIVVRKEKGPDIPKVEYVVLPKICSNPLIHVLFSIIYSVRFVMKLDADYILAYHYTPYFFIAYFASLFSGKPYILGQTGSDVQRFVEKPVLGKFLTHIIKKAYSFNVPGNNTLGFWQNKGIRNVRVLHSTIDTDHFVPRDSDKTFDFLFLGRLERYKGVHFIIEAFANILNDFPEAMLSIVGDGPFEEEFKSLVKELGISNNVIFHGFQRDTYKYYKQAKMFVMASEGEGLPCALMEAMSCEMLCISSKVGNIADILEDEVTGYSYDYDEMHKLEGIMNKALRNYEDSAEIRQNARKIIVENHSHLSAIRKWEQLLSLGDRK